MEVFQVAAMALVLLALAVLIFVGGRPLRPGARVEVGQITGPWPKVSVLVPVTGAAAGLATRLAQLLSQDYPDYQVVFATRDAADPATAIIRSLLPKFSGARHVVAGPARGCGQKNQNLLAAVQLVGRTPEILVFCDSNQEAEASWLKELVAPMVAGRGEVTSGYHHIIAAEPGGAALGRAISVLILYLTKGFRRLNQPWGGATAIRRSLFENLDVARLWAENIVDDVSLAARLVRAGIPVVLSPRGQPPHSTRPREPGGLAGLAGPAMALPEVLHARHLAGRGLGGAPGRGPGGPGRGAPILAAPGGGGRGSGPGGRPVFGGAHGVGPRLARLSPAPRPPGKMAAGLLCGPGPGQLVPPADPVYHGDALAGDYLPGGLARQGGGDSSQ